MVKFVCCPYCDGRGWVHDTYALEFGLVDCHICMGSGKVTPKRKKLFEQGELI